MTNKIETFEELFEEVKKLYPKKKNPCLGYQHAENSFGAITYSFMSTLTEIFRYKIYKYKNSYTGRYRIKLIVFSNDWDLIKKTDICSPTNVLQAIYNVIKSIYECDEQ